jgi:hypothetical protein
MKRAVARKGTTRLSPYGVNSSTAYDVFRLKERWIFVAYEMQL